ncbi:MAG TPA: hypothetical protein VN081_06745 [Dongiaceae bacterium]|nr:hypothetical protein [Dongiaceae bacterium]
MRKPLFEIIVSTITLIAVLIALLQLPFGINSYDSRVTPVMFFSMGALALASALVLRHQYLRGVKNQDEDTYYKGFFYWALPLAVYALLVPWLIAGVLNAEDVNTFGALGLSLLLVSIAALGGIIALAVFWAPVEITARGLWRFTVTRGKDGQGQLVAGLYFMLCEAALIVGSLSATTERVGQYGHAQLVQALLGLPGDYTVENPGLLWVTRLLFILMIGLPFVYGQYNKRRLAAELSKKKKR